MRASITASRRVAQVVLALCLISAIVIVGLVATSTRARPFGPLTPHVAVSSTASSPAQGESAGELALGRAPEAWCGSASGACP